jgi:hypothetical protein
MYSPFEFSIQNFWYAFFLVKKLLLHVIFSIPPCGTILFFQCSRPFVDTRFIRYMPNLIRSKNMKSHNPYQLQKMVFWPPKLCIGEKKNLSTLNVMISQTVRNECPKFDVNVDIHREHTPVIPRAMCLSWCKWNQQSNSNPPHSNPMTQELVTYTF